jgi:hypothetical protein
MKLTPGLGSRRTPPPRAVGGIAVAVALFVAVAASPAGAVAWDPNCSSGARTTNMADGSSNTIMFGAIAKSKLGELAMTY